MTNIIDEQLAQWRALADAATPGPWHAVTTGVRGGDHWYVCDEGESIASIAANDGVNEGQRQPDAEFIAAAREAVPVLLDALAAAERLAHDRHLANEAVRTELVQARKAEWVARGERDSIRRRLNRLGMNEDWWVGGAWGDYGEVVIPLRAVWMALGDKAMSVPETGDGLAATYRDLRATVEKLTDEACSAEAERDALKARIDAVRELHRQVPIYPYVDDCSEDHGHDDGLNMVGSDDGEWLCTASVPLYFVCDECWDDDCCRINWPCATVRVLDGLPAYLPPRTVVDVHLPEPGEAVSTDG